MRHDNLMKQKHPDGPFGPLRPLNMAKTSEAKLLRYYCYGWLRKAGYGWELNERGEELFYITSN